MSARIIQREFAQLDLYYFSRYIQQHLSLLEHAGVMSARLIEGEFAHLERFLVVEVHCQRLLVVPQVPHLLRERLS